MHALLMEMVLSAEIVHGAGAGEHEKVADEVRWVEIPAVHRQPSPVRRCGLSYQGHCPLKPLHAREEFRRQSDFFREDLDEPPLAEANAPGDVADHRAVV